jgi:excreted virulence factor EspC (type VII ESX diderm)
MSNPAPFHTPPLFPIGLPHPPTRKPTVVHPAALRQWAAYADEVRRAAGSAARLVARAGEEVPSRSGWSAVQAAAATCAAWAEMIRRLDTSVDGFGAKLVAAAAAYERNDGVSANLFAPARSTPAHEAGGGRVAM